MALTVREGLTVEEHWHHNLSVPALIEAAIRRGEGVLTVDGALATTTGEFTGRSPRDRFIVREPEVEAEVHWGPVNQPFDPERFERLCERVATYLREREAYVVDAFAGADPRYRLPVRVVCEFAWHALFARHMFIRPRPSDLVGFKPEFTVLAAPSFRADPARDGTRSETFIIISFRHRMVIIGGTEYAGEIKKSIFGVLNFLLPARGVVPMHCSANAGRDGDVALFFGLSGTGKTTLSTDPNRFLIGDDEHGWSDDGIFNFEAGSYAKTIHLSPEKEPLIYNAIRFGTVLENVVVNPASRVPDYDDGSLTENARAAYPIEYIPAAEPSGRGGHPRTIFFLTADAFGVLPPIARLDAAQAMYHFLSGYTSKLAGTERGLGQEPAATFSTCFGEPFMPRAPHVYAQMLGERIARHGTRVYLLNTGWTGGPYGVGRRIDLDLTRAMVTAAVQGALDRVPYRRDPVFGFEVPLEVPGVPSQLLDPRQTWQDKEAYDAQLRRLAEAFARNFERFADAPAAIREAGPRLSA